MHIGIIPNLDPLTGGGYQYTQNILAALNLLDKDGRGDEFTLFAQTEANRILLQKKPFPWSAVLLPPRLVNQTIDQVRLLLGDGWLREALQKMVYKITPPKIFNPDQIRHRPGLSKWLKRQGIDWVFYTEHNPLSFEVGLPYVMPVHDLQHRLHPEFPEVSANGRLEWREYLLRNGARSATLILADSEVGKENILEFYGLYGVTPDQIKVLPFAPANYLSADVSGEERARVRRVYHLPERYMFYPAQFWPHKNHVGIVRALARLKEEQGSEIHLVLCGSYSGAIRKRTFHEVMKLAHQLKVHQQVHYLGYLPYEDMASFYAEATALVMPTFFGPTSIPILEAWLFSCPVLTSDIRGIREQAGDAAILVDPRSEETIADGMCRLWGDETLRKELGQRGCRRLSGYQQEDFSKRLGGIIQEANERVREGRGG